MNRIGIVQEVQAAPDGRLADPDRHLRISQRFVEVGEHGGFGLGLEVVAEMIEEHPHERAVEARLVGDHDRLHDVEVVEPCDFL